ncbi:zinc ABC transporter substrate-binding protein [Gordonia sp. VNQ95]|uniref:metal ABC transporter solute-binding protein, Zn/Mn family n=1 Tax=Gordonia sp. VNQ95 TaxID=3156619 RepID=UPI0032B4B943
MTFFSRRLGLVAAAALLVPLGLAACSSDSDTASSSSSGPAANAPACPTTPVNVVVSVDQWGDIVSELGGKCADVKTIVASSSVDPHDYEPSPADGAAFTDAQMVVVNGADYDVWASKLAAASAPDAPVVNAAQVTGTADGANPHLWYSPTAVTKVADAVTEGLSKISPDAQAYFATQRSTFTDSLSEYNDLIAKIKAGASGKTFAATEGVFDYMAQAVRLVDKTPAGFAAAAANESDPSPADLAAFIKTLSDRQVDVLIYNTQTEGSTPEQIRAAAESAGVPVVEVTETVPPGQNSFESWQVDQLTSLAKALGVQS